MSGPRPTARRDRPVTMRDIAVATGVSRSTVSRVLNDAPLSVPIARETRERVVAAARDLGYRPNPLARALRGAPTMLVGAIVRDITDPFFAGAIEAISNEARARGYNIVLGHAHARAAEAMELAAILEARQCDAILLLGDMGDQPRLLADLRDTYVPVVTLWQGTSLDVIPGVQVDNRLGIRLAIEHLRGLGHRRIAFTGGRLLGDIRERQAAYQELVSADLGEIPTGYVQHVANTTAGGEAALGALLRLEPRPTAVVAATDVLATGILRGALLRGVKVPDTLSVVGFDDIPMATLTVPALTTVQMPMAAMAAEAIDLALGSTGGTSSTPDAGPAAGTDGSQDGHPDGSPATEVTAPHRGHASVRVFPPVLVIRDSTASPPEADGGSPEPDHRTQEAIA